MPGLRAVAVHLYPDRLGDDVGLSWCSPTCRNHWTMAGAGIVIASGLYLLNRERKWAARAVAPIEPG